MSTSFRLLVPADCLNGMIEQARSERPNECCGLLAGAVTDGVGRVTVRYPLVNALASPTRYESEPRSMFDAVRDLTRRGLDILAVYHSHPTSPPLPSRLDRELNYGPDVVNLIISLCEEPPTVRAWWLTETDYREAEWSVG